MGVPPEVSSAGYEFRLFVISTYVNMSLLFPARMHISTPLQLLFLRIKMTAQQCM